MGFDWGTFSYPGLMYGVFSSFRVVQLCSVSGNSLECFCLCLLFFFFFSKMAEDPKILDSGNENANEIENQDLVLDIKYMDKKIREITKGAVGATYALRVSVFRQSIPMGSSRNAKRQIYATSMIMHIPCLFNNALCALI